MPQHGAAPDPRYEEYVPRLVQWLGEKFGFKPTPPDAPPAKAKGKNKAKAKAAATTS
jgi:hypothetical protein